MNDSNSQNSESHAVPNEALKRLDLLSEQVASLQQSMDRLRRAAYIRLVLTIIVVVLPLIGLMVTLPRIVGSLVSYGGLPTVGELQQQLQILEQMKR